MLDLIKNAFSQCNENISSQSLLEKCAAVCTAHHIAPAKLATQWEVFVMNRKQDTKLSMETLDMLAASLKAKADSRKAPVQNLKKEASGNPTSPSVSVGQKRDGTSMTPHNQAAKKIQKESARGFSPGSLPSPAMTSGGFAARKNAGQVVAALNEHLPFVSKVPPKSIRGSGQRVEIVANPSFGEDDDTVGNVEQKYRYMYTSLEERAQVLERQLYEYQEELQKKYHLKDVVPVSTPSQETVVVCGRVCCDAATGKLNKTAVMLEGSIRDSGGMRIKLELTDVQFYALFPGQIICVEGINSTGRRMVAKKIYASVPKPAPTTPASRLLEYQHDRQYLGGNPLTMLAAAGPYTTADNLDYQPLRDMLSVAGKLRPDVLLLVGPFIDCDHPEVASGEMSVNLGGEQCEITHKEFFMMRVQSEVEKLLKEVEPRPKVVLVPSLNDIHHDFVYPQPPFRLKGDSGKEGHNFDIPDAADVVLLSNPATFRVNEVTVGVNASDILLHLGPEEISRVGKVSGGRLARLAEHCVAQHSYYPLFPARAGNAQLDLRHYKKYAMPRTPDILVVPSKLAHFVKKGEAGAGSNVCLNPGQLTKGTNGGTFARFTIHPIPQRTLEERQKAELPHDLASRTRVEIMRI